MVRRVKFDGNAGLLSGHNDLQLRRPMEQKASPPLTLTFPFTYFIEPAALSLESLRADARRLEVWYAHHGWFDARFSGWEVRRVRKRSSKRAGVVDVIGHVVPGRPSEIRSLEVITDGSRVSKTVVGAARLRVPMREGEQFDLETARELEAALVEEMQDHSFAFATSKLTVDVYAEEHVVDVKLEVDPGKSATFGEIRIEGLNRVEEAVVRSVLTFRPGGSFRVSALRQSQQQLFETRLFSIVDLTPDLSDPESREVPVVVRVTESKARRFRFGAGVVFDYFTLGPRGSVEFRDLRLFGSRLQMEAKAGVGAIIGVVRDRDSEGSRVLFTGLGSLRFDLPWLKVPDPKDQGRSMGVSFGGKFQQDAQFGDLPYWSVAADVRFRYRFSRYLTLAMGPRFEYFRYLRPSEATLEAARLQFGGDFVGATYRLLTVDAGMRLDYRDDLIRTRRGTYWGLDLRQSIPIPAFDAATAADLGVPEKGFLYTRLEGELRAWVPLRFSKKDVSFPVVLAGKLHAITLIPWEADATLPYPDLAFLGGPNSLRGFRTDQVGPYDAACSYRDGVPNPPHNNGVDYDVDRTYLPRGGAGAVEGMGELRYDWRYGVSFALFGDVGMLARRWNQIAQAAVRGGGGVGLRYDSPVGPIRLDLGVRPTFAEDRGPDRYVGCNVIDRLPRGYDLFTGTVRTRERLAERNFPVAFNLFFAIGEAF